MPYIDRDRRARLNPRIDDLLARMRHLDASDGDLNYVLTRLVNGWIDQCRGGEGTRYAHIAAGVSALECAKLELYRKRGSRVEDDAAVRNGGLPIEGYGGG